MSSHSHWKRKYSFTLFQASPITALHDTRTQVTATNSTSRHPHHDTNQPTNSRSPTGTHPPNPPTHPHLGPTDCSEARPCLYTVVVSAACFGLMVAPLAVAAAFRNAATRSAQFSSLRFRTARSPNMEKGSTARRSIIQMKTYTMGCSEGSNIIKVRLISIKMAFERPSSRWITVDDSLLAPGRLWTSAPLMHKPRCIVKAMVSIAMAAR